MTYQRLCIPVHQSNRKPPDEHMPHALNLLQLWFILHADIKFTLTIIIQKHEASLNLLDFLFFHTFFTPVNIVSSPS